MKLPPVRRRAAAFGAAIAALLLSAAAVPSPAAADSTRTINSYVTCSDGTMMYGFAINYGTGGIGAEVYANRIGVGPMGPCVDCKFEEFFLSAWSVGDPAMLVDRPVRQ